MTAIQATTSTVTTGDLLTSLREQASMHRYGEPDDAAFFAQPHQSNASELERLDTVIARCVIRTAVRSILAVQADNGNGLEAAYTICVWDGEDFSLRYSRDEGAIMSAIMATDEDALIVRRTPQCSHGQGAKRKHVGTAALIYGNSGCEVIADYSVTLEDVLKDANKLAAALEL